MRNHNIICTPNEMHWNIQTLPKRTWCNKLQDFIHSLCLTQFKLYALESKTNFQLYNIKCNYIHDVDHYDEQNDYDKIEQKHAISFELIRLVSVGVFEYFFLLLLLLCIVLFHIKLHFKWENFVFPHHKTIFNLNLNWIEKLLLFSMGQLIILLHKTNYVATKYIYI